MYVIITKSGHHWLIEDATSEADALEQYYDGGAEHHISISTYNDQYGDDHENEDSHANYLRDIGQAS